MPFSKEVRTDALVAAARHCCVCHRYKGVKVEVHHIRPEAESGDNTASNAIALCFDCHTDAGHYNSRHPRGTKFSARELLQARDEWHRIVQIETLDIPDYDSLYCRYLICKNVDGIKEIVEGDLSNFPAEQPRLVENSILDFQRRATTVYGSLARSSRTGRSKRDAFPTLESYPEAQHVRDDDHSRPLWGVYLAATNITDRLLRIAQVNGQEEAGDGLSPRVVVPKNNRDDNYQRVPKAPLPAGATLLIPIATMLGPLNRIKTVVTAAVGSLAVGDGHYRDVLHEDISGSINAVSAIGPAFWPVSVAMKEGSQPVHSFDPTNVYTISQDWGEGG